MKKVVNIINWNEVMETVRVWLENIIIGMGFRGGIVPVLRHLLCSSSLPPWWHG